MTINELIERLQGLDPSLLVCIEADGLALPAADDVVEINELVVGSECYAAVVFKPSRPEPDMAVAYVTVDYDQDPDLSWYEGDKSDLVTLEMTAYSENGDLPVDSLCNITFLREPGEHDDDWEIGTFYSLAELPAGHLREVAREMHLGGEDAAPCRHRDDGRGRCIDCDTFI
jgi:hypothetical protein